MQLLDYFSVSHVSSRETLAVQYCGFQSIPICKTIHEKRGIHSSVNYMCAIKPGCTAICCKNQRPNSTHVEESASIKACTFCAWYVNYSLFRSTSETVEWGIITVKNLSRSRTIFHSLQNVVYSLSHPYTAVMSCNKNAEDEGSHLEQAVMQLFDYFFCSRMCLLGKRCLYSIVAFRALPFARPYIKSISAFS